MGQDEVGHIPAHRVFEIAVPQIAELRVELLHHFLDPGRAVPGGHQILHAARIPAHLGLFPLGDSQFGLVVHPIHHGQVFRGVLAATLNLLEQVVEGGDHRGDFLQHLGDALLLGDGGVHPPLGFLHGVLFGPIPGVLLLGLGQLLPQVRGLHRQGTQLPHLALRFLRLPQAFLQFQVHTADHNFRLLPSYRLGKI